MLKKKINPTQIIQKIVKTKSSGKLEIKANSVIWNIYFSDGILQYANHSLQSFKTIQSILLRYNLGETVKNISQKAQSILNSNKSLFSIVDQLVENNFLNRNHKKILHKELTQNAIKFFLWLTEAEFAWIPQNNLNSDEDSIIADYIWDIRTLVNSVMVRLNAWQKFAPFIQSPLQCPICLNDSLFRKKVASGNISPAMCEKLIKLMRGATIHEIGIILKQTDLKIAQFLFPYIQDDLIKIQPPQSPLDRLPMIPPSIQTKSKPISRNNFGDSKTSQPIVSSNQNQAQKSEVTPSNIKANQKIYKIVSIDDSPTMLDLIKNYLGTEKYEVCTIENPMLSLGPIFDMKPDLILLDFSMPKINGNKLCQILRRSHVLKQTPIIMVSGNCQNIDKAQLESSGINDYLAKPFTREDLLAIVAKYVIK